MFVIVEELNYYVLLLNVLTRPDKSYYFVLLLCKLLLSYYYQCEPKCSLHQKTPVIEQSGVDYAYHLLLLLTCRPYRHEAISCHSGVREVTRTGT